MNKKIIANELLPVYQTDSGEKVVDGRELHEFLKVGRDFTNWIKDRIQKYGFVEGEDFSPVLAKTPDGGRPRTDYILKLDMAKELSMVENNEQGSKARKYFIEVEKKFKTQVIDVALLSPELQMFKQIWDGLAKAQIEQAETRRIAQEAGERVQRAEAKIATIKDTFMHQEENWRDWVNDMIKSASYRSGGVYQETRSESYRLLEERGRCDLNKRLRFLKDRLEESGATKTKINAATKMDVIEADARLREIYTTIVKELSIASMSREVVHETTGL